MPDNSKCLIFIILVHISLYVSLNNSAPAAHPVVLLYDLEFTRENLSQKRKQEPPVAMRLPWFAHYIIIDRTLARGTQLKDTKRLMILLCL